MTTALKNMEWLRCNKCYILMAKKSRNFVMTQCGHIFCDQCLSKNPPKCQICGTVDFRSCPLAWPPKLETVMNYFSSVTDFTQMAKKGIQFYEDQLMISLRGFKELAKKYENGKRACMELMKEIEKRTLRNMEARDELEEVKASIRMLEQQSSAEHRQGFRTSADPKATCETPWRYDARDGRIGSSVCRNATAGRVNIPADAKASQPTSSAGSASTRPTSHWTPQPLPKYPYYPHPAFTNASLVSVASMSDSGCETAMDGRTPASVGHVNFAVPSTQRVPKSVASVRRRARTLPRLSDRKTGHNL